VQNGTNALTKTKAGLVLVGHCLEKWFPAGDKLKIINYANAA
jgi:hypothetical protein